MSTAWVVGYVIGGAVVALVAVLLLLMIRGAHRAAVKAEACLAALHDARDHSEVLWAVNDVNTTTRSITTSAAAIREHLTSVHGSTGGTRL